MILRKQLWLRITITLFSVIGYGYFAFATIIPGQTLDPVFDGLCTGPTDPACAITTGWQLNVADGFVYNTTDMIGIGTDTPTVGFHVEKDTIKMGDSDMSGNKTSFTLDDGERAFDFKTYDIFGNQFSLSGNGERGDVGFFVDDNVEYQGSIKVSNLSSFMQSQNSSFGTTNVIQTTTFAVAMSSVGVGGGVTMGLNSTGMAISDHGDSYRMVSVDRNPVKVLLGDIDNFANGTSVSIEDDSQSITFDYAGNGYTFPVGDGTANYLLATDGAGQLFWQDPTLVPSDQSLKRNIADIEYGLDTITKLRPVSYQLITNDKDQIGFIAQEVDSIIPELVGDVANGRKGVAYGQLTAVLVKAVQELNLKLETIERSADGMNRAQTISWLASLTNGIEKIYAQVFESEKIQTNELCIGNTCLNESQINAVLDAVSIESHHAPDPSPLPISDPVSEGGVDESTSGDLEPEVVPEIIPEGEPDPISDVLSESIPTS